MEDLQVRGLLWIWIFQPFFHGLPDVHHGDPATEGSVMGKARNLWDGQKRTCTQEEGGLWR